ncbi:MAG: hypothetical protein WBP45_06850 [Daejeonella sp.]
MKNIYKVIIAILLLFTIMILVFLGIGFLQLSGRFFVLKKRPLSLKEKIFIDSLKKDCNCSKIFRYPKDERDFFKPNSEYIINISLNDFELKMGEKKDSLGRIALSIAQKSYKEINNKDTSIFTKYGIIFWGKETLEFHYKVKDLE